MSGKKSGKLWLTCLAYVLAMVCALAVTEGYFRLFSEPIDLYELTGKTAPESTRLRPMAEWAHIDAFSGYRPKPGTPSRGKTVNRAGFVSTPEITLAKPPGTIRIVFLGGSSTAGTGTILADDETWPWKSVEVIRERTGLPLDFINGAVGGYSSFESYGRLWSRIRHYSPDMVVLCHGWNEMYYFNQVDDITNWRVLSDGSWSMNVPGAPVAPYVPHYLDRYFHRSQLLTRLRLRFSGPPPGELGSGIGATAHAEGSALSSSFDVRGLEIWRTQLRLFQETCDVIGARLFVVKQATLIVPNLAPELREKCHYEFHGFDHDTHVEAYRGIYRVIDEVIPAESIIDMTGLSGREEYLYDHAHPKPDGTTAMAALVADALLPCLIEAP